MVKYVEESIQKLKQFEGCVPWMYRDTAGKVTVGVGLMLPDAASACALPFVLNTSPATHELIAADFSRVQALPEGREAEFYRTPTSLELPQPIIDERLGSVVTIIDSTLREKIASYDTIPDSAKLALLDMAYNLGAAGLLNGYPRLIEAVEAGAWGQAAAECERHGPDPERNLWTRQQFLSAIVPTIRAEAERTISELENVTESALDKLRRTLFKRDK